MDGLEVKTGEIIGGSEVDLIPSGLLYKQCSNNSTYRTGVLRHSATSESTLFCGTVVDLKERVQQDVVLKLVPETPGLFISVSKGLTNLHWNSAEMENFSTALADVAKATEACVITSGLDAGVAHFIGKSMINDRKQLCIGIPPLGSISSNQVYRKHGHTLEENHDSFVFLTDAPSGADYGLYREQMEQMIVSGCNNCAQRVLIVIGGGFGTLMEVKCALYAEVPVLLCMGTNGAADFLKLMLDANSSETSLELIFYNLFNLSKEKEKNLKQNFQSFLKIAKECMEKKHLISVVWSTTAEKLQVQLKTEIILAVFKAARDNTRKRQMIVMSERLLKNDISLLVNSCNDIVGTSIKHEILSSLYKQLPDTAKVRRVLRTSLDDEINVWDAFMNLMKMNERQRFLNRKPFSMSCLTQEVERLYVLTQVENLLSELLGEEYTPHLVQNERKTLGPDPPKFETVEKRHWEYDFDETIPDEVNQSDRETRLDFFICSLLREHFDAAAEFWRNDAELNIHHVLLAVKLQNSLSEMQYDTEDTEFMTGSITELHNMVNDFLYACAEKNKALTENMVLKGSNSYLQQAYNSKNYMFATHPTVKNSLNRRWRGCLTTNKGVAYKFLIFICIFLPILIPMKCLWDSERIKEIVQREKVLSRRKRFGFRSKLWYFYSAPVVKTMVAVVLHVMFLMLYSFSVLIHLDHALTVFELALCFWVIAFFVEEVKQFQISYNTTGSMWTYFHNPWNVADIFCIVSFGVAMTLKTFFHALPVARIILVLDLYVYFVRVLYNFTISETVGPQLVMIVKMLNDLLAFSVIMLVFVCGYAVSASALMYPDKDVSWDLIDDIMGRAFWILYGENNLEQYDIEEPACTNNHTILHEGVLPRCPSTIGIYLVPYLQGAYAFLMVILMLNLLIAQFNFTFTKIQEKADWYWSSLQLTLINELHNKPLLPPPFTMLIIPIYFLAVACQFLYLPSLIAYRCCISRHVRSKKNGLEAFAESLVKCFWSASVTYKEDETFEKDTKQEWNQRYEAKLKRQKHGQRDCNNEQCVASLESFEMISKTLIQMRSQITELTRMVNQTIQGHDSGSTKGKVQKDRHDKGKKNGLLEYDDDLSDTLQSDEDVLNKNKNEN